jgi:hypothetical protein
MTVLFEIVFQKNEFVFYFWNYNFSIIYSWCFDMRSEIIQGVAYDNNYDDF